MSASNVAGSFNVAKFGGTSVANFEAMSRCAAIIENNSNTKLVVSSACSGVTNLLVELANGVQDKTRRQELVTQLTDIHNTILAQLADPIIIEKEVHSILDDIASAAEAASFQVSTKLTDHLVACGELMSTHILAQIIRERGTPAVRFDIREVMRTNDDFGKAEP
ncbi:lysine-sensitive aspartokinase 3, partial [Vibrio lentus]|nr:lysine-sensitive aspartokinase 3 [Vibrio lentus]